MASPIQETQHFRLFDLPQELQDLVYRKYFEDAPRVMFRKSHPRRVSLRLERAGRKICKDSRRSREIYWPKHLEIGISYIEPPFFQSVYHELKPTWLHNRIEKVTIEYPEAVSQEVDDSFVRMNLRCLCHNFPRLKSIFILSKRTHKSSLNEALRLRGIDIRDPQSITDFIKSDGCSDHLESLNIWVNALQKIPFFPRWGNDSGLPDCPLYVLVASRYTANNIEYAVATKLELNLKGWSDLSDNPLSHGAQQHFLCSNNSMIQQLLKDKGYEVPKEWCSMIFSWSLPGEDRFPWVEEAIQLLRDQETKRKAQNLNGFDPW